MNDTIPTTPFDAVELPQTVAELAELEDTTRLGAAAINDFQALFKHDNEDHTYTVIYPDAPTQKIKYNDGCTCGNHNPDTNENDDVPTAVARNRRLENWCEHAVDIAPDTSDIDDFPEAPHTRIDNIAGRDNATVEVIVEDLWEPSSDKIYQAGLVADYTDAERFEDTDAGTTKFTIFADNQHKQKLKPGRSYILENVKVNEYNGKHEIIITHYTQITYPQ